MHFSETHVCSYVLLLTAQDAYVSAFEASSAYSFCRRHISLRMYLFHKRRVHKQPGDCQPSETNFRTHALRTWQAFNKCTRGMSACAMRNHRASHPSMSMALLITRSLSAADDLSVTPDFITIVLSVPKESNISTNRNVHVTSQNGVLLIVSNVKRPAECGHGQWLAEVM